MSKLDEAVALLRRQTVVDARTLTDQTDRLTLAADIRAFLAAQDAAPEPDAVSALVEALEKAIDIAQSYGRPIPSTIEKWRAALDAYRKQAQP